ncbi:MAG: hypothetical protein KUG77_04400 [Nannocystaceae bacterium]|nr:hypothetical protein [Nannocystaceae bacterium]
MRTFPVLLALLIGGCATTIDKARDARNIGEYDEARSLYEEAMAEPKMEQAAREELAQMYVDRAIAAEPSNRQEAEREYRQALVVDGVFAPALTGLVRLLRDDGRIKDARLAIDGARKAGECPTCNRLELVVLLEEADAAAKAERWKEALTRYSEAQEVRPQPAVAVSIVQAHIALGAHADAVAALQRAVPMMIEADANATGNFVALRGQLFKHALEEGDVPTADQVRALSVANESQPPLFAMELRVADHLLEEVDGELALARFESMLARKNDQALSAKQVDAVNTRVARIYANSGTALLNEGKSNNADWAFKKAIEIRPDDWSLKLQRVIAISESVGSEKALKSLSTVPEGTYGLKTTLGIVAALKVRELLERGQLDAARTALAEVQSEYGSVPEGHLVAAMVLAKTPFEGLSKRERKVALSTKALVMYPGDRIYRYAEAKAELGWVKMAMAASDKDKLFIAPWLGAELARMDRELSVAYPPVVEFWADPEPVIVLHNTRAGYIDVVVEGEELREEFGIPTGDRTEFTAPLAGLLYLRVNGEKRVFVAEPYAKVTIRI